MSKEEKNEIYQTTYNYTAEEKYKLLKAIPTFSYSYYITRILITFFVFSTILVLLKTPYIILCEIIFCIIYFIFLKITLRKKIYKENKEIEIIEIHIFDTHFIIKTNFRESKNLL